MVTISLGIKLFLLLSGVFFGLFLFSLDFHGARAVNGAESAETALAQSAFALELALGFDGEAGPRDGLQTSFWNGFARQFADAISVFLDALEGFLNFVNGILIRGKKAQCEITVKIVSARVCHVQDVGGHLLGLYLV